MTPTSTGCDQAIDLVHASLDGALPPAEAARLEQHLQSCASCSALQKDLAALVGAAGALPRELAPREDLWSGIKARIEAPRRAAVLPARWTARRITALAGTLALAAAVLVGLSLGWPPAPSGETATGPDKVRLQAEAMAWEAGVREATAELEAALASQQDQLDPETLAVVQRNLRIIDQAIEETRAVLAKKPQDNAGRAALAALHQHKLQLLRQAVDLSQSG